MWFQNQNDDLRGENNKLSSKGENLMNEVQQIDNDYRTQIQQKDLKMKVLLGNVVVIEMCEFYAVLKIIKSFVFI